jgi:histidinol-phosphate aminotransferase
MTPPFSKILSNVPAMTPFVGPEAIERRLGHAFRLRLGANESAFGASPKVKAALAAEAERVSWYCDPEHFDLREKLAGLLGVGRDNIVIGEGIDGLLGLIVRAFADPGDAIVTSAGAYPTFNYHVIGYGGRLEFVPYTMQRANDPEALIAAAVRTGAKLVYLANPDNPTGSFLGRATVEQMISALPANCLLVLDEAYAEFAPPDALPPIDPAETRVIRLRTFSKAHGLAGMRVGYGIATAEIVAAFDKIRLHFGVGRLAQVVAAAALDDPGFAAEVVRKVAEGRRDYEALGRALNLATLPSLTNFVPFDLETGERAARMLALLEERDVFVRRSGVAPLDRYVRVTVGTGDERAAFGETFKDALTAL